MAEFKRIERLARSQNWTVEITRHNHVVYISPTGTRIIASSTPSCRFAHKRLLAMLRRAGLRDMR